MIKDLLGRRKFLAASAGAVAAMTTSSVSARADAKSAKAGKLAILGGKPVRTSGWPRWPHIDDAVVESVVKTTKSGIWCRIQSSHGTVPTFEKKFAKMEGAKLCVCTGSGTQALHTAVEALGIGPGDEIITSPYTDPGTIAAILAARALPVMADLDVESYQIDPDDVEKRITKYTKAIMPVHMMGQPADMDSIMAIAKKHKLRVIEDACQGALAVHRGKKLGTIGDLGCISFQTSKTISCGEGGAILGDDEELMDKCYTVQNHGTSRRGRTEVAGPKYRMNEFEGAVLLGQLPTAKKRFELRNKNARHLSARLKGFKGLVPQKLYDGTESGSWYLYPMSYHKEHFGGASRAVFLKAMAAEGVGLSPYIGNGLHKEPWVDHILGQRVYKELFPKDHLEKYRAETGCPRCDQVCAEMVMLWASGPLLGTTQDMDEVVDAIFKVHENRDKLASV